MAGDFGNTNIFRSIKIRDQRNQLSNVDSNNKLFRNFVKQRWRISAETVPMTRQQFSPYYTFLLKQNGTSGIFTFQYPLNNSQGITTGADGSTITAYSQSEAITSGTVGPYTLNLNSDENSPDQTGAWRIGAGDFIKFANHSKIYKMVNGIHITCLDDNFGTITVENAQIYPAAVVNIPANTSITLFKPSFTVSLMNDVQSVPTGVEGYFTFQLDMVEEY